MASIETNRSAPMGAITIYRAVDVLDGFLARMRNWLDMRRTRAELDNLTDAQLADIGLSRREIDGAARRVTNRGHDAEPLSEERAWLKSFAPAYSFTPTSPR